MDRMANDVWLKCTKEKRQLTELGSAVCCPLFPSVSTGYEPKSKELLERWMQSAVEETADERLDRLIALEREAAARRTGPSSSVQPAVRSVRMEVAEQPRMEETPGRDRLEGFTMGGLHDGRSVTGAAGLD